MHDIGEVAVENLLLDPQNPRIPEMLQDESQEALLEHLFENDVLDELASSMLSNGYFENEPILVLPADADGKRVVVEGNRRTATLMVLLNTRVAQEAEVSFDLDSPPDDQALSRLASIPCFEVADRAEVSAYLGYRHIGGLRQWPAEAKARFIAGQVRRAEEDGSTDPFYSVGRMVGSNARGVRSSYETLEILRFAQRELSFNTSSIRQRRFTVWGLLVSNSDVREFINYSGRPRTFVDVKASIAQIDEANLIFVLEDLVPSEGGEKPVLADSRSVSLYAQVLKDDRARATLERYNDLELAAAIIRKDELASQLTGIAVRLESILVDAGRVDVNQETSSSAIRVRELSEAVEAVVLRRVNK